MKFKKTIISLSITMVLVGCSSTHTGKFSNEFDNSKQKIEEYQDTQKKVIPTLEELGREHEDYYVDLEDFSVERVKDSILPLEFKEHTEIFYKNEPTVNQIVTDLFLKTGIQVEFVFEEKSFDGEISEANSLIATLPEAPQNENSLANGIGIDSTGVFQNAFTEIPQKSEEPKLKKMNYKGSLQQVLDYVGVLNGLKWKYDEKVDKVFFFERSIETFYIFEQGLEINSDSKITTSSNSQGENGSASLGNQQNITMKRDENSWKDIEEELKTMLSKEGKIAFNKRQGSVVVQDNDYVLSKIRERIENINTESTKTITIDFSIVNVKLEDAKNLGINWNYVNTTLKNKLLGNVDLTAGSGAVAPSLGGSNISDMGGLQPLYGGNYYGIRTGDNFNMLLGMLGEIGTVNITSKTAFPSLNNHPTTYQISQNEDYVSSINREKKSETGDENVSTEIDTVRDGITLTVRPKIIGEQVMLEYSMSLAVNDGLTQAPGVDGVQLPKQSNKDFSQSIIANNGQTTVIMAFQKEDGKTNAKGPGSASLWFLGGSEAYSNNKEIVVITATPFFELK